MESAFADYYKGRMPFWNDEYNKWVLDKDINYTKGYIYHQLSKVNFHREFKKTYLKNLWCMSKHPNITWDIILANPDINWHYVGISANPHTTWDIIQKYPNRLLSMYRVSVNPNITWDIIINNSNLGYPWNWFGISQNSNITWEIIMANPGYPWNWVYISHNPNITWDIIQANPEYPWNFNCISMNPNITWEIIQANPDKPWNWDYVSYNPNITWDIIETNINKFGSNLAGIIKGNIFTAQARISLAKHQLKAHQETNYLARYMTCGLLLISLEHGY